MTRVEKGEDGLYEAHVSDASGYRLVITYPGGHMLEVDDPYRYGRVLTDFDLHLFGEGTHLRAHEKLGAHRIRVGSTTGVHFAVWAPNADRVSVIGDFNGWTPGAHPLRELPGTGGVWSGELPGVGRGALYKYHVRSRVRGYEVAKADPFAIRNECPPRTASIGRAWSSTCPAAMAPFSRSSGITVSGSSASSRIERQPHPPPRPEFPSETARSRGAATPAAPRHRMSLTCLASS